MAFGLVSTTTEVGNLSLKSRRKIFWQFPSGAAPLMGLLSFLPSEDTDKVEFGWWERRFPILRTLTVASGTVPFYNADGSTLADQSTLTADTEYMVFVQDTSNFKPTHVIQFRNLTVNTGTNPQELQGSVVEVVSSTRLIFRPDFTVALLDNTTTRNVGIPVAIIGTANPEGGRSGVGVIAFPINPTNYTQIFRTAFSLTRTALKQGLAFDRSGPYKIMAKENGLRHMVEMEKSFLFGRRHTVQVTDPDTGDTTPETKTGGIVWYLEQWEAANSNYRIGQTNFANAITLNTDDDKRIIDLSVGQPTPGIGVLSKDDYNGYMARLFRKTNDKAYEKLCLCGGGFLQTINTLFEREVVKQVVLFESEKKAQFIVHAHSTLRGTVYYKVHPLFDEDLSYLQYSAMFIDLGNLMYRPLTDSDTVFLKGRQETDRDGRKDEWITETGLELRYPESCMYMKFANTAV